MRTIDKRFIPAVSGIDRVQALNYISIDDVDCIDFFYDRYTSSTPVYRSGARPELEGMVAKLIKHRSLKLEMLQSLADFVCHEVQWAGFYHRDFGKKLPADRNLNREEDIISSGYGWCNEQARVLCALTQIAGLPSRLIFASDSDCKSGHVVVEVLVGDKWLLIDQSFGFLFVHEGNPVNAYELYHHEKIRCIFAPKYRKMCCELTAELGRDILSSEFSMSQMTEPLAGFAALGYCNHFVY